MTYTPILWLECLYISLGLIALSATPFEKLRNFVHVFYQAYPYPQPNPCLCHLP